MKLIDLVNTSQSPVKVLNGGNGRILCYPANPKKHQIYMDIDVMDVWADMQVSGNGFTHYANPIICCYVSSVDVLAAKERANNEKAD